jgi:hypothetical protein
MNNLMEFIFSDSYQPELIDQLVAGDAFDMAIAAGRLSALPDHPLYAGQYMYMGGTGSKAMFKHIKTREYIA